MKPLLSILIPTVVGREKELDRILGRFGVIGKTAIESYPHCDVRMAIKSRPIEIYVAKDDKQISIGEKRENLYKAANGLFSVMWDDDDDIADNGIELILAAIKSNPEIPCITYREKCMMNGVYKRSNHSITYSQWMDNQDGYDYVRSPFYKDVIRTDIARSVPFPKIRWNEDEQWSYAIKPFLNQEIHIDEEIYHYIYNETNHQERYGLDKD